MARHRRPLALILICLPILVTVIAAFRVRDFPSLQDNVKTDSKRYKCVNCEVNDKTSVKLDGKRTYEDLKKAVREKQSEIHKKSDSEFKINKDATDDDDEDDVVIKSASILKKDTYTKFSASSVKLGSASKNIFSLLGDDDDDDDDDDEDENVSKKVVLDKKKQSLETKEKNKPKSVKEIKRPIKTDNNDIDDDDDDKNNDNSGDAQDKKIHDKRVKTKTKSQDKIKDVKLKTKIINSHNNDDDDDDDDDADDNDDDDDDDKVYVNAQKKIQITANHDSDKNESNDKGKLASGNSIKPEVIPLSTHPAKKSDKIKVGNKITSPSKPISSIKQHSKEEHSVKHFKIKIFNDDDADDDDDDDDDDERESIKKDTTNHNKIEKDTKITQKQSQVNSVQDSKKIVLKDDDDDDDDEDDDNGDDDGKRSLGKDTKHEKENVKHATKPDMKIEAKPDKKVSSAVKSEKEPAKPIKKEEQPKDKKPKEEIKIKSSDSKPKLEETKKEKPPTKKDTKESKPKKKEKPSVETLYDSQEVYHHKPEDYLKDINEALQRRNLLQSEFEDFYAFFPTFAPNFSRIHNPECRRHGQILLRQLRGTKLWALNMLDATAKIPSGILQGNGIQLGDFDQCLASRARVQLDTGSLVKIQGKYCLASLDVKAEHPELEIPVHLAQAKNLIKSKIDDPGHFVPRFSTLSWGICLPSACSAEDVQVVIKDALKHYQHTSGIIIRVKVEEQDCYIDEGEWWENWLEVPTLFTVAFYGVIVLLVFVATFQDFLSRRKSEEPTKEADDKAECDQKEGTEEEKEQEVIKSEGILSSFSLYHTIDKLLAPVSSDEIACIHGIRGIATLALLVGHKFLPIAVMPYTNRLDITEIASSPIWSWVRAGWVFTDCFLLLSGTLTAHRIPSDGAPKRLFFRYLRLTPAHLAIVLFYAYVWDNISSGPMWGSLVTKNAEICQEGWWWNMLYIQNYFGFEEMCAPQTHQLALDFQLTILGGIIVWLMQARKVFTFTLLPILHILAAYSRYTNVQEHRLTMVAYHGVTVSQLYRTARLSYTSVFHRSTPYLVGISLGLMLQNPTEHGTFVMALGWITSAALWCMVWYAGYDSGYTTYRYSAEFAAQYAALAPIASALAIAWVIYAVQAQGSGFLSRVLCCRLLLFISRLSYALYLCQFVVFISKAAMVRSSTEFTLMSLVDMQEISTVLLSATVLTLTFVIPMQSLHKIFTFSIKSEGEEEPQEESEDKKEGRRRSSGAEKNSSRKSSSEREQKFRNRSSSVGERVEESQIEVVEEIEIPQIRSRHQLIAHREVLEEIPEVEIEFEAQRDKIDGLEEILEEEEDEIEEELQNHIEEGEEIEELGDDIEELGDIAEEEEEEGGEDFWVDREEYIPRRSFSRNDNQEPDEWTSNDRNGGQYSRYMR